jgi:hypothetical protein
MQPLIPPKPQRLRSLTMEEKTSANRLMAETAPLTQQAVALGGAAPESTDRREELGTEGVAPIAAAQDASNGWTSHNTERREESIQQEQPPTINHSNANGALATDNVDLNPTSQNEQQPTPPEPNSTPNEAVAATANGNTTGATLPVSAPQNPKPQPPEQKYFWRMVGECYVHGMMDGEAIAWQNEEEVKPEIFDLRR